MKQHFVIMADIIMSSKKPAGALMDHFKYITTTVNDIYKDKILSPLTITLGDEFQGITDDLSTSAKIILTLDELLLNSPVEYSLRYIVNYGEILTPVNTSKAYEMLGPALTDARKQLEIMKAEGEEIRFLGFEGSEKINLAFQLYRSLYNSWSHQEKKIVKAFLEKNDYRIVAKLFDRDSSSMWRKEKSLKIREFRAARELIYLLAK